MSDQSVPAAEVADLLGELPEQPFLIANTADGRYEWRCLVAPQSCQAGGVGGIGEAASEACAHVAEAHPVVAGGLAVKVGPDPSAPKADRYYDGVTGTLRGWPSATALPTPVGQEVAQAPAGSWVRVAAEGVWLPGPGGRGGRLLAGASPAPTVLVVPPDGAEYVEIELLAHRRQPFVEDFCRPGDPDPTAGQPGPVCEVRWTDPELPPGVECFCTRGQGHGGQQHVAAASGWVISVCPIIAPVPGADGGRVLP